LFSHTNSTGNRHSAARFSDSWNSPSADAPSPKNAAVTMLRSRIRSASPSPIADGNKPPTIA